MFPCPDARSIQSFRNTFSICDFLISYVIGALAIAYSLGYFCLLLSCGSTSATRKV